MAPDGRTVAFAVWGDPDGFPVLALHGTPGCRLNRWSDEDLYRRLGVCLVTHDRAGYGRSDRRHGRRVADEADDVVVLAANVPGCVVKVDDTAGHLGSDPEQEIAENLGWLRDGVPHREAGRAQPPGASARG